MTYIVGLHQPGINAIISDTRISLNVNGNSIGSNTALKTGKFFPGCIFARIGNVDSSNTFIINFKKIIYDEYKGDEYVGLYWKLFLNYIDSFDFSKHESFQLLLSSRVTGKPEFYLLDSSKGTISKKTNGDIYTYGSGRNSLDDFVFNNFDDRLRFINQLLQKSELPKGFPIKTLIPYPFCLWLSQLSMSFLKDTVEADKTGGLFHFIFQTDSYEAQQQKSIIFLMSPDSQNSRVSGWIYRIIYNNGYLVIESQEPKGIEDGFQINNSSWCILCDTASRINIDKVPKDELIEEARSFLKNEPFFFFSRFAFTNPELFNHFGIHFSFNGEKQELFDSKGHLQMKWQKFINIGLNPPPQSAPNPND
jgi:hypothetical protein